MIVENDLPLTQPPPNSGCEVCMESYRPRKHVSPSSFCKLSRCPRLFYFQYGLGLRKIGREDTALVYGSAVHYALPACYPNGGGIDVAMDLFKNVWGDYDLKEDPKRNTNRVRLMLLDFIYKHKAENSNTTLVPPPPSVDVLEKVSDNEVAFALDVGLPVPVVGRVDAVVTDNLSSHLWGDEYKTSARLGAQFLGGFNLSPQVLTYTMALRVLTGKQVDGCIIEGLLSAKTKTETLSHPIWVTTHSMDDIVQWYKYWFKMLLIYETSGSFPKNLSMCTSYDSFGTSGFVCDFQDLCMVDDWRRLESMYEVMPPHEFLTSDKATPSDETT